MSEQVTMNPRLSRRHFLAASGATTVAVGAVTALGTSISLAAPGVPGDGDVLVVVNLGGGCDGLAMTPPLQDPSYYDVRPTVAVPRPGQANGALPLADNGRVRFSSGFEGAFGLNPAAQALHDGLWSAGRLAVFPGIGFPGSSLSHFTSSNFHRKGTLDLLIPGTWLGRMSNAQGGDGQIQATGVGDATDNFSVIGSMETYQGGLWNQDAIARLYSGGRDLVSSTGRTTLARAGEVGSLPAGHRPGYPETGFGLRFSELAQVLKRRPAFGIKAAQFSYGNWDHHTNLGRPGDERGNFHSQMKPLADALQAFADDTNGLDGIVVVITTEFGRTINENGAGGTDHGEGLTMLVAGGGIRGGVYGDDYVDSLTLPNGAARASLPIGTDYRKPLSEIIRKRVRLGDPSPVFPDFAQTGNDFGLA